MIVKVPEMILFDYGGTLLCEPDWDMLRGEKSVFEHVVYNPHGYTPEEISSWETGYFQSLQGVRDAGAELTEIQMLRMKYELHGIKLDISYEEAELILWDHAAPMTEGCVYPNIRQTLEYLYQQEIRTGVISNIGWTGRALARRINTLLPDNHFEFIIASSDYGLRKPDQRLFRVALERAALAPGQVWFCGDTYDKDIEGAHSLGMFPVYYQGHIDGDHKRTDENVPLAGMVIKDWSELQTALTELISGEYRK